MGEGEGEDDEEADSMWITEFAGGEVGRGGALDRRRPLRKESREEGRGGAGVGGGRGLDRGEVGTGGGAGRRATLGIWGG